MPNQYTEEELKLMKEYMGLEGATNGTLFDQIRRDKKEAREVLVNAQCWELDGKPTEDDE